MRELAVIGLIGVAVWFFTIGVRIGLVGTWPTTLLGAKGENRYVVTVIRDGNTLSVKGSCRTWSGRAEVAVLGPRGEVLGLAPCTRGDQPLNMAIRGVKADYTVRVKFENYSGTMDMQTSVL